MTLPSDPLYLLIYVVIIIVVLVVLLHILFHFIAIAPIGYVQTPQQLMDHFSILLPSPSSS